MYDSSTYIRDVDLGCVECVFVCVSVCGSVCMSCVEKRVMVSRNRLGFFWERKPLKRSFNPQSQHFPCNYLPSHFPLLPDDDDDHHHHHLLPSLPIYLFFQRDLLPSHISFILSPHVRKREGLRRFLPQNSGSHPSPQAPAAHGRSVGSGLLGSACLRLQNTTGDPNVFKKTTTSLVHIRAEAWANSAPALRRCAGASEERGREGDG